ncbi:PEP/pyruvate-binding domain-containing protein [Actinopolymorpha pittospori]|uniref:Phosphoenolpyruvate synthase n=1 Tax=Actinopolymorpha pittospori TaxID=648752 RepID=A0A927MZ32_9ACTN|nr:hypothetical protein [Actinopolymorpha pittospori]
MNEDPDSPDTPYVVPLDEGTTVAQVGGKGASLARLAAARLPIPPGFHVTTAAYHAFVAQDARQGQILAAVAGFRADDPVACEEAADKIARLFVEGVVPEPISEAVREAYAGLGSGSVPVAVRSSATAEDLPEMSFAGQQDTYLNIHGEREVLAAVRRCWASLWTARAIGYRLRNGIPAEDVALAVVVQELVPADAAGVLFTADPMTGATDQVLVNATWGLGEALVGGQVTPDTILVDRATGAVTERRLGDKAVMTVRTSDGTREVPVPAERRSAPVLTDAQAGELARLGVRVEGLYDRPMDIEWARHDGTVFIVQARPITALRTSEPATEEWNDTRHGDYLWTSANLGEAIPDVMTPATWSLIEIFMAETMALAEVGGHRLSGNIAGRFYLNLSVSAAAAGAFGLTRLFLSSVPQVFGRIPDTVTIPPLPMSRWELIRATIPPAVAFRWRLLPYQRNLDSPGGRGTRPLRPGHRAGGRRDDPERAGRPVARRARALPPRRQPAARGGRPLRQQRPGPDPGQGARTRLRGGHERAAHRPAGR